MCKMVCGLYLTLKGFSTYKNSAPKGSHNIINVGTISAQEGTVPRPIQDDQAGLTPRLYNATLLNSQPVKQISLGEERPMPYIPNNALAFNTFS